MKDEVLRIFDKQTAHREKFSIQAFKDHKSVEENV